MKDTEIPEKLNQMIFIYNALMNGWTVKKSGKDNSFEFCKKKNKKEIDLEKKSLNEFISENI